MSSWRLGWSLGLLLVAAGCKGDEDPDPPLDTSCQEGDCGEHGVCVEEDGVATCICDLTYHADGLECVADERPPLACPGDWVTHHLGEPYVENTSERSLRPAEPLRLRGVTVGADLGLCSATADRVETLAVLQLDPATHPRPESTLAPLGFHRVEAMGRGYQLVWAGEGADPEALCALSGLATATAFPPSAKLGTRLLRHGPQEMVPVTVLRVLAGMDGQAVVEHSSATMTPAAAAAMALDPHVLSIDEVDSAGSPLTHVARRSVRTEELQDADLGPDPPTYGGPVGRGITIAIVDTGVDFDHPDLVGRVVGDPPYQGDSHGTNVAGVAAGSGAGSDGEHVQEVDGTPYLWRGHSPEVATIVSVLSGSSPWDEAFVEHDALVSNHSYTQSDGDYVYSMAQADEVIREGAGEGDEQRPPRVTVWAAANNGTTPVYSPLMGYYSILAPGKNPICVGGSNANDDTYSMEASAGPTLDGRIKPDLIAPGYKQYRPPDGVVLHIDEIRLTAVEGSGYADLVWGFDTPGSTDGWIVGDALEDLLIDGGSLEATGLGSADQDAEGLIFDFVAEMGSSLPADAYEELALTMRLEVGGEPEQHKWPYFWVASWGFYDDSWDGHTYPNFDEALMDDGWHEHTVRLADSGSWSGDVLRLRVWPTPYDYRMIIPRAGGGYDRSGGTSLAAPVVTGVVASMMEVQAGQGVDLAGDPPINSTYKALLIHTARDRIMEEPYRRDPANPDTGMPTLYFEGPDFASGYGLLDAVRVHSLLAAHGPDTAVWTEQSIEQDEVHIYTVPVDASLSGRPLTITLAWDDAPGSTSLADTEPLLVNDLDMVLVDAAGIARSPWVLDPLPIDEDDIWDGIEPIEPEDIVPARRCVSEEYWLGEDTEACEDHRNNVEQIVVDAPQSGWQLLMVRGTSVPEGPQRYSLVLSQDCGDF